MTVAWCGIFCSKPPCITVSLRKATCTYGNIMARMALTVSIPSEAHVKEADYFGLVSGKDVGTFTVSGLTPVRSELVDAQKLRPLFFDSGSRQYLKLGESTGMAFDAGRNIGQQRSVPLGS